MLLSSTKFQIKEAVALVAGMAEVADVVVAGEATKVADGVEVSFL